MLHICEKCGLEMKLFKTLPYREYWFCAFGHSKIVELDVAGASIFPDNLEQNDMRQ